MTQYFTCLLLAGAVSTFAADPKPVYENNFEKAAVGNAPDDMLVLDGAFAVKEEGGNKFLELPGAPLDTFGALFGPTETNGLAVSARVHGTSKGRRFPTFGVGLNGVGGHRLLVSPAKKLLELYKGDEVLATAPYSWVSDSWTLLRLQSRKTKDGEFKIEGKAWKQGDAEPKEWQITHIEKAETPAGRPSLWGNPYAGTAIRYDDLRVTKAE
ncbi:MAG TPA: hypothetical protein VFT34_02205 [Verrucomicrobiae bacterium]|nr:hypothetical protein [Verrucomicrobiae bacterium]